MNIINIKEINSIDNILFKINDNNKVTILSSGNVGIGTTSPSYKLDVIGDINISSASSFKINGVAIATTDTTYTAGTGISISGTTIDSLITQYEDSDVLTLLNTTGVTGGLKVTSGNVGIGTSSPSYKLDVNDKVRLENAIIGDIGHGTTYCGFMHSSLNGANKYALLQSDGGDTYLNCATGKNLNFRIQNSTKMQLNSNGNIGIGTIPQTKLHIYVDSDTNNNLVELLRLERHCNDLSSSANAEGGYISLKVDDDNASFGEAARISWRGDNSDNTEDSGRLGFWTSKDDSCTEKLTITKDGNIGIGTTSPASKLDVNGTSRFSDILYCNSSSISTTTTVNTEADICTFNSKPLVSYFTNEIKNQDNIALDADTISLCSRYFNTMESISPYITIHKRTAWNGINSTVDIIAQGGASSGRSTHARIRLDGAYTGGSGGNIKFQTIKNYGEDYSDIMHLDKNGVGIGTSNPGSYKLYVTGGSTYGDLLYGANIKNTNGIIGNTLTFNRNQVNIAVGSVGYLHSMENNPTNGFGFTDNHKRSTNTYGKYIRFWIKGASNGNTIYLQGFANYYYNSNNQLKFMNGTTLTDSTSHCINNTYVEGNKGQRWMVTPWYDTASVGGDGFRLGVKNIQGSTFYMTQVVLEFTKNASGLS